ncbi:hypothetical protein, partial [Pseudoalteromonas sp. T1lg24]|uniref:hypothetical protein n=1 Tax=Pseudoalteromonas sp. T1lg24 TaxID=2077099 RepID=UPI00131A3145
MLLNKFSRFKQILFWLLLPCIFIFEVVPAYAYTAFDIHRARSGYVLARGLVLENDLPIWAQYNENGKIVGAEYPYASNLESYALSAHTVNASLEALSQLKSEYGDRLVIMSREQYESATLKTGLKNNVDKFSVSESIKSVVFLEPKTLVSAKQHIILLRARFDLNSVGPTNGNTRSLLLNRSGQLIAQSEYNFAFKSAFYEGDGGAPSTLGNLIGKKAYAPFKGSFVEVMAPYGGMAVAEEDGRWVSHYGLVPCPMFFFEYNTPAYMNYYYANFNPKLTSAGFDYQVFPGYDACIGYDAIPVSDIVGAMVKVTLVGLQASIANSSIYKYNFFVDTNILGGQAEIYDPFQNTVVPIGSETKYIYREPEIKANEKPMFYFDGDELAEYILYGDINNEGEFVCKKSVDDSKYYGVYLSSNEVKPSADCDDDKAEIQQPDLIRVVDIVTDLQPQGLLESLSEDDLRDTDIFIFRESSGMLLTQRKGADLQDGLSFYGVINEKFSYQLHMRGPKTLSNHILHEYRGEDGFSLYQSKSHMNPELHRREADHLKPNEMLRIILINRKTGYIGSKLRSFSDIARQNASVQEIYDFADITEMYPPNLKVTAERIFEPNKNSIKTGQQKNEISYEGSALSSDSMLVLTTEWFDNDGTPLPAGLADFGYTGRLAKVAGNNSLVTVGGELANFAIKPGR